MTISHLNKTELITFFKDKRVLITGGTKGLGRGIVEYLCKFGAKVTVVARTQEDLEEMNELSDRIYTIQADISRKEDIHRISGQAIGVMEGIDILINNASTLGPTPLRTLSDTQCEDLEHVLQTNLLGPFRLIKAVLPAMQFMETAKIINISSDAAVSAYPTWGGYSISKSALDHMTAVWREELDHKNIEFVSLDPGDMHTEMHLQAIPDADITNLHEPDQVAIDLLRFIMTGFTQPRYSATEWRQQI